MALVSIGGRGPVVGGGGGAGVGAAGGACGAAACGCETEGAPVMSFVGSGRGEYIQETSYKYVGPTQGEFEVVAPRSVNYCFLLVPCLALLGLLLLLLLLWPQPTSTTSQLYDCNTNFGSWQSAWSIAQQSWCCTNFNKGCTTTTLVATLPFVPTTTVPPTPPRSTTQEPFNCNEGGIPSWSSEKREYCCRVYKNGCPTLYPPPTPPPYVPTYDCAANYANWVTAWSVEQKAWCCKNTGKGCPASGGCETGLPFDCAAGYANWQVAWSAAQKAWCCQHTGKGCQAAPCPTSY